MNFSTEAIQTLQALALRMATVWMRQCLGSETHNQAGSVNSNDLSKALSEPQPLNFLLQVTGGTGQLGGLWRGACRKTSALKLDRLHHSVELPTDPWLSICKYMHVRMPTTNRRANGGKRLVANLILVDLVCFYLYNVL